jgi:tRNA nucleotidyltransferase (CCA-adding enzyme)
VSVKQPDIDLADLGARLGALPGVERVREAAADTPVHLVGGAVRDLLLGRPRADLDLVVEGEVDAVAARLGGEVTSHERFGTATVRVDGLTIDLATARAESYASPGALPEVRPSALADDLARRDFTVNAMALGLRGEPELVDPHRGLDDLRAGMLRVLHPRSFEDDPTRALRAARYAARLGLALEPETAELLEKADLSTVSADRVDAELRRLATEDDPAAAFALAREWGLIEIGAAQVELIGALATLLAAEPWSAVAERGEAIVAGASGRLGGAPDLAKASPKRASEAVAAAHGHSGIELALARAMGAEWLDRYVGEWRDVRLEISGNDLLAAGVPQGPAVGRGLRAALDAKLDGTTQGRDDELRVALGTALRAAGADSP